MSIESTTNINGLNEATPNGEDSKSEGDNHIRLLKVILRSTFPGFSGKFLRINAKSANYTVGLTDNGSIIKFTSAATLSGVPSTLGNGWMAVIYNAASANVVIDPTSTILVNGNETLNVAPKSAVILLSDGTSFIAFGVPVPMAGVSVGAEFGAGTRLLFQQSTAPVGWTLITDAAYNDAALRLIGQGAAGTGGVSAFSTIFGSVINTLGHVLTTNEIPPHSHSGSTLAAGDHAHTSFTEAYTSDSDHPSRPDDVSVTISATTLLTTQANTTSTNGSHVHAVTTINTGGGAAHTHPLQMNLKYVDFILAQKQ
jgi:hypothetical protein